ncbi:MAG: adenylate kinase family protein [Candidatus Saliniplasma sp.]
MTVAITGTPGIGKTTVAGLLREEGYNVLDLNGFIDEKGLRGDKDENRNSHEVEISRLKEELKKISGYDIVEGHLSHHLGIEPIIVLRCAPKELKCRMSSKDWQDRKEKENLEAEILDVILIESLEYSNEVYEIDTTDMKPMDVCSAVKEILDGETERYSIGQVDWSSEYGLLD